MEYCVVAYERGGACVRLLDRKHQLTSGPSGYHLNCRRVDAIECKRTHGLAELAGDNERTRIVIDAVTINAVHCKSR